MTTTWYALGTILTTTYHILQPAERKSDGLCSFLNVSRDDEWWIIDLILRFLSSSLLAHLIWNQPLHNLIVRDSIEDNSIHPLHQHYLISLFDSVANLRFLFLYQLPGLILLRLLSTSSQWVSPASQPARASSAFFFFRTRTLTTRQKNIIITWEIDRGRPTFQLILLLRPIMKVHP